MHLLRFRRRPLQRVRVLGEAECYARCHGDRGPELRLVQLEPRRPRHRVLATGEEIRASFEQRLESRGVEA